MGAFLETNNSSLACWWRRRTSHHVSAATAIVLGGCPRSGTTVLRVILDSHPHIASGPETSLLEGSYRAHNLARGFDIATQELWQLRRLAADHVQFIELFFERYAASRGKLRWAEKTPRNIFHVAWIFRHFPHARFIHIVRDGRDVVGALRTQPRFRRVNGAPVRTGIRRPLKPCIQTWLQATSAGLQWRGHANYLEVRFEDLLASPEATLRTVCAFIGEPYEPSLLQFHQEHGPAHDPDRLPADEADTRSLSRRAPRPWEQDWTGPELALFDKLAGHRLTELGYSRGRSAGDHDQERAS